MHSELKPCPFCGGTATIETIRTENGCRLAVYCDDCDALLALARGELNNPDYYAKEKAKGKLIEAWNKRNTVV